MPASPCNGKTRGRKEGIRTPRMLREFLTDKIVYLSISYVSDQLLLLNNYALNKATQQSSVFLEVLDIPELDGEADFAVDGSVSTCARTETDFYNPCMDLVTLGHYVEREHYVSIKLENSCLKDMLHGLLAPEAVRGGQLSEEESGSEKGQLSEEESGGEKGQLSEEESGGEKGQLSEEESGGEKGQLSEEESGGEKGQLSEEESGGEKGKPSEKESESGGEKGQPSEKESESGGEKGQPSEEESGGEKGQLSEEESESGGEKGQPSEEESESGVCRYSLRKVNSFFQSEVDKMNIPNPKLHIGDYVMQHIPDLVSIRRIMRNAGKGSGLVKEIQRRFGSDPRWANAWLHLRDHGYRSFEVVDVFWR
ncbi:hypothetical protein ACOMHN_029408 [Nucella lapillus]